MVLLLWLVMGMCSGLLMMEGVAITILFITCGIGAITFVIPTLFLYLTAVVPSVVMALVRVPWWAWVGTGLLGLAGMAFGPPLVSHTVAHAHLAYLTADDVQADLPQRPRHLRIVRQGVRTDPERRLSSVPCEAACQTLLYGDEVEAVEVRAIDSKERTLSTVWRRALRISCPEAFADASKALPATVHRLATGDCLLPSEDEVLEDAPWLSLVKADYRDRKDLDQHPFWHPLRSLTTLTAGLPGTPMDAPLVHRTEVTAGMMAPPTLILPDSGGMNMSLAFYRPSHVTHPTSEEDALRELFGFTLAPLAEPPAPGFDTLERLLDNPNPDPFGPTLQGLVDGSLREIARSRPVLDEAALATLARLARDGRVTDAYHVAEILRRDPEASRALVPAFVDRIALPVPPNAGHTHNRFARMLLEQPVDLLQPHATALEAAVRGDGTWATAPLLSVLPLLTGGTMDLMRRGLHDDHAKHATAAIAGICNATSEEAAPLLDEVLAHITAHDDENARALGMLALQRHGRAEEAEALMAGLEERDRTRVTRRMEQKQRAGGGCRL